MTEKFVPGDWVTFKNPPITELPVMAGYLGQIFRVLKHPTQSEQPYIGLVYLSIGCWCSSYFDIAELTTETEIIVALLGVDRYPQVEVVTLTAGATQ